MTPSNAAATPAGHRPPRITADLPALRADLAESFQLEHVEELLGPVAVAALHREQRVPALLAARQAGAAERATATLTRLFLLGDDVRRRDLDAALPRVGSHGAQNLGLVITAGAGREDAVRAAVDLRPYEAQLAETTSQWWVASDRTELTTGQVLASDHVLGIGAASTTLAGITWRAPRERVLDLGTGCGVQALHASQHSTTVVATDISTRALEFARFNTALAEVSVDLRHGSLFEPVAAEHFDLVVSNPPFVITPAAAYHAGLPVMAYRDGQRHGDDLVRDLILGVADRLRPGGVAQLLGNWEHHRGEEWSQRLQQWLAAADLEGWIVEREVQDPAEYAEVWLRDGGMRPTTPGYDAVYQAWVEDFQARGVQAIGFGYLTLRRPTQDAAPRWRRVERLTGPARHPLGEHLGEVLRRQEWLATLSDAELAQQRLVVGSDVTEERHLRPGAADPEIILLRQGGGFGRTPQTGTVVTAAVGACDGELTLHQIIGALSTLLEVGEGEIAGEVLPAVRELILDGFLHPYA